MTICKYVAIVKKVKREFRYKDIDIFISFTISRDVYCDFLLNISSFQLSYVANIRNFHDLFIDYVLLLRL